MMYFTKGRRRQYERLMQEKPGFNRESAPNRYLPGLAGLSHLVKEYDDKRTAAGSVYLKALGKLATVIFPNPENLDEEGKPIYETADAYLSGNVREKLRVARQFAAYDAERYGENVKALEAVQPKDLDASEIDVRLGATWLPPEDIRQFLFELVDTPPMYQTYINVMYSEYTAAWNVKGKSDDRSNNIKANVTYGTSRVNAYKILEDTLNLRDVRVFDTVYEDGVEKRLR
jgi:N12 class adenine-specific DNA methylase